MGRRSSCGRVLGAALGLVAACFNPSGMTDMSSGTFGTSSSSSVSTTASVLTTGVTTETTTGGCEPCSPPTPHCLPTGQCGSCEALPDHDMSCAALTPATPACDPDSGECVECVVDEDCGAGACDADSRTCVGCVADEHCAEGTVCDPEAKACVGCVDAGDCTDPRAPVCDADSQSCRRCREHRDCPATACELDVGSCFPNDSTQTQPLYVDAKAQNCATGSCEVGQPCCELATALEKAGLQPKPYVVIRVAAGTGTVPAAFATSDKRVAVLADANFALTVPINSPPPISFGKVNDIGSTDSKLFLSGLKIAGGSGAGAVSCYTALGLWLDEVEVHGYQGLSLVVHDCELQARRSQFVGNQKGVQVVGSSAVLENTILAGITVAPVIEFLSSSAMSLRYTTVGESNPTYDGMIDCDATSKLSVRNSLLLSSGMIDVSPCSPALQTVVHTASTSIAIAGAGDNRVVSLEEAIPLFASWMDNDLRLLAAGSLAGIALWEAAIDPPVDFEGARRPARDGTADVPGADLPGPPPDDN